MDDSLEVDDPDALVTAGMTKHAPKTPCMSECMFFGGTSTAATDSGK